MGLLKKILSSSLAFIMIGALSGCSKSQTTETPEQFLIKYFTTTDINTMASYTLEGEEYKNILTESINKKEFDLNKEVENFNKNQANIEFTNLDSDKDIKEGDYIRIRMSNKNQTNLADDQVRINYLKKVGNSYKIDRRASKGINDMSFMDYKVNAIRKEHIFRVYAKISDYYNYEFRDGISNYYSIKLYDVSSNSLYFSGYISKNSADGQNIYNILKDNQVHAISVEISVPDKIKLGNDIVVIDKLISDSWLIKEENN